MSNFLPCMECGADDASPCNPDCGCFACQLQAIPIPTTVEQALHAANVASFEGREFDAQLHMVRLRHLAAGIP